MNTISTWPTARTSATLAMAKPVNQQAEPQPDKVPTHMDVRQVEIVFTLLFSRFYLKEVPKRSEVAGLVIVVFGVLLVVLGH